MPDLRGRREPEPPRPGAGHQGYDAFELDTVVDVQKATAGGFARSRRPVEYQVLDEQTSTQARLAHVDASVRP